MEQITLKKVRNEHAEFLTELMNNEIILNTLHENQTSYEDWSSAILQWMEDSDEDNYIIYEEDLPVGWVAINGLDSKDRAIYLKMIAIIPSKQNQGFGTIALQQVISYAKSLDYKKVCLYTDLYNHKARKCYSNIGFYICDYLEQKMANKQIIQRIRMELLLK